MTNAKTNSAAKSADKPAAKDDPKQTWVVGHDGKRYKSEDYAKTDEARGVVNDEA